MISICRHLSNSKETISTTGPTSTSGSIIPQLFFEFQGMFYFTFWQSESLSIIFFIITYDSICPLSHPCHFFIQRFSEPHSFSWWGEYLYRLQFLSWCYFYCQSPAKRDHSSNCYIHPNYRTDSILSAVTYNISPGEYVRAFLQKKYLHKTENMFLLR